MLSYASLKRNMSKKQPWPHVPFADVIHLNTDRIADPAAAMEING